MASRRPLADTGRAGNPRWLRNLVALLLLFTLLWLLLGVFERELQRAEEQAANRVLAQLRSALVIRGAEVMLDRQASLEEQEGINPFDLLDYQWGSYAGQCAGSIPEPGSWCFRARTQKETAGQGRGWLIYNPRQSITLLDRQANAEEPLAWTVTTEFVDSNGNGRREQSERATGLRLKPVSLSEQSPESQNAPR